MLRHQFFRFFKCGMFPFLQIDTLYTRSTSFSIQGWIPRSIKSCRFISIFYYIIDVLIMLSLFSFANILVYHTGIWQASDGACRCEPVMPIPHRAQSVWCTILFSRQAATILQYTCKQKEGIAFSSSLLCSLASLIQRLLFQYDDRITTIS